MKLYHLTVGPLSMGCYLCIQNISIFLLRCINVMIMQRSVSFHHQLPPFYFLNNSAKCQRWCWPSDTKHSYSLQWQKSMSSLRHKVVLSSLRVAKINIKADEEHPSYSWVTADKQPNDRRNKVSPTQESQWHILPSLPLSVIFSLILDPAGTMRCIIQATWR